MGEDAGREREGDGREHEGAAGRKSADVRKEMAGLRKVLIAVAALAVLGMLVAALWPAGGNGGKGGAMKQLDGKKVVMVIASDKFRDEELKEPKEFLEKLGAKVTVASTTLERVTGMLGAMAKPEILLDNVEAADYDAVVFIGGFGAQQYFQDPTAHALAQDAARQGKVLGAICIAPALLANAGLLNGKTATCYESEAETLKKNGANYTGKPVEVDGKIVTGNGPDAAKEFGQALAKVLAGK